MRCELNFNTQQALNQALASSNPPAASFQRLVEDCRKPQARTEHIRTPEAAAGQIQPADSPAPQAVDTRHCPGRHPFLMLQVHSERIRPPKVATGQNRPSDDPT